MYVYLDLEESMKDKEEIKEGLVSNKGNSLIIIFTIFVFLIVNILSYIYGMSVSSGSKGFRGLSSDLSDYRKFMFIRSIINNTYNGEYSDELLIDGAIKGMVNSLDDPYTVYMDNEEFEDFNLRSQGNYVGIGIQVGAKDGKIYIVSVFSDSPADKSGIRAGDFIVEVSGEEVSDKTIDKAISCIKGEEGTEVSLKLQRDDEILNLNVKREKIDILPVESFKVDEDILYLKINSFDENSYKGVKDALDKNDFKGIVLDLRGNPGGLLNECVNIASEFLKEGSLIVSTDNKYGDKEVLKSHGGSSEDVPMVVLGNSGSASASEVLIGALRDNDRAIFIGNKTFGKGLVQRVFDLGDGSGLKVTVSKYYTPKGDYINKTGITPDILVDYTEEEILKNKDEAKGDLRKMLLNDPQYNKALEVIREKL